MSFHLTSGVIELSFSLLNTATALSMFGWRENFRVVIKWISSGTHVRMESIKECTWEKLRNLWSNQPCQNS